MDGTSRRETPLTMKTVLNKCRVLHVTALVLVALAFSIVVCSGHDETLHVKITDSAFRSSSAASQYINEHVGPAKLVASPPQVVPVEPRDPIEWLTKGSFMEDAQRYGEFKVKDLRCLDHFYTVQETRTPGEVIGLTDDTEPWLFGRLLSTLTLYNSFVWASDDSVYGPAAIGLNFYNWPHARDYQYAALTLPSKGAREEKAALMLYALGHVLHLNQDLSQPGHVRNDNHNKKRAIEKYGKENFEKPSNAGWFATKPHGWAYWREQQGFSKLLDFWDRGMQQGKNAQPLDDDRDVELKGLTGKKLGLAEFSAGNFLSEDALYNEVVPGKDKFHHFPFPSLLTSTKYAQFRQNPTPFIEPTTTKKGRIINTPYIRKEGDGVTVAHHSTMRYLGAKYPAIPKPRDLTLDDPKVLHDYHNILIPKAVEYSAGILDYFFRGRILATMDANVNGDIRVTIKNVSGQDLKGGTFELFWDSSDGTRSPVTSFGMEWFESSNLPDEATVLATFTPPSSVNVKKYTLVYQGTIATTGQTPDPVDQNIAIACAVLSDGVWWNGSGATDVANGYPIYFEEEFGPAPVGTIPPLMNGVIGTGFKGSDLWEISPNLALRGDSFTVCLWINPSSLDFDPGHANDLAMSYDASRLASGGALFPGVPLGAWEFARISVSSFYGDSSIHLDQWGDNEIFSLNGDLALDSWNFLCVGWNRSDGHLWYSINGGAKHVGTPTYTFPVAGSGDEGCLEVWGFGTWVLETVEIPSPVDEVGFFQKSLTPEQITYLFNNGNGRTWPVTLPQ
jgi:hypothetical protein